LFTSVGEDYALAVPERNKHGMLKMLYLLPPHTGLDSSIEV
jgi:hypothetical protein